MDPATLVKLGAITGIALLVIAIGLRSRPADTLLLVRNPALGLRAMVAMFVLVPAFVLLLCWLLPLTPPVRTALLALSVSPMPPLLAGKEIKAGGRGDYAIGLQVLACFVSILVVPAMLLIGERLFGVTGDFDPLAMAKTLLMTVGVPLAVGITIARFAPAAAPKLSPWAQKIGLACLGIASLLIVYAAWPAIAATVGQGALLACAAMIGFGLLAGHLLGGPDNGNRGALAVACAARHPGVALTVAGGIFPGQQKAILAAVGLFVITNAVLTIPYMKWRKAG